MKKEFFIIIDEQELADNYIGCIVPHKTVTGALEALLTYKTMACSLYLEQDKIPPRFNIYKVTEVDKVQASNSDIGYNISDESL